VDPVVGAETVIAALPVDLAPPKRFQQARTNFGKFASSGNATHLGRALSAYTRSGYGGGAKAAQRLAGSTRLGARLLGALSVLGGGTAGDFTGNLDRNLLLGRSFAEISETIVAELCPHDGSLDAEGSRRSIHEALSRLLDQDPDADLLNLSDAQRLGVVREFLAAEVTNRVLLDCEASIRAKASLPDFLDRIRQVKDYIRASVEVAMTAALQLGETTTRSVTRLLHRTVAETLRIFEEYT